MTFYFLRHGETLSNTNSIYAGWSNEGLTPRGRMQAEEAAKKLANFNIDVIYSSPLRRAVQTAETIATYLNKILIIEETFKELRLGLWEGLHEDEIAREFKEQWNIWNKRPGELVLDGRETLDQLLERALTGINKIKTNNNQRSAVVVTHVPIIRVIYLYINKIDINKYRGIEVNNGQIFLFRNL